MGKQAGITGDMHHRLPGGNAIAVIQGFNIKLFESAFPHFIQLGGDLHLLFDGFQIRFVISDKLLAGPALVFDQLVKQLIGLLVVGVSAGRQF